NEAVLILKTRQELMEELIEKVRSLHSYDVPCIVSLRVLEGNPEFLKWVEEETGLPK
ncbi:MAG: divalent-cation tolerance protein CutA, partial [Deltaproteobacteria bacterium]